MKTFEVYRNNMTNIEEIFLRSAHLNDLEIYVEFILYYDNLFYFYEDDCLFIYNKVENIFYVNKPIIYSILTPDFYNNEITNFIIKMINNHFNVYDFDLQFFNTGGYVIDKRIFK